MIECIVMIEYSDDPITPPRPKRKAMKISESQSSQSESPVVIGYSSMLEGSDVARPGPSVMKEKPCCSTSQESVDMIKAVRTDIKTLKSILFEVVKGQEHIRSDIHNVKKGMVAAQISGSGDKVRPKFKLPVNNLEEFTSINKVLEDGSQSQLMTEYLSRLGGSSFANAVYNIMRSVMAKELAVKMTVKGQKIGKPGFIQTNLYKCVLGECEFLILYSLGD